MTRSLMLCSGSSLTVSCVLVAHVFPPPSCHLHPAEGVARILTPTPCVQVAVLVWPCAERGLIPTLTPRQPTFLSSDDKLQSLKSLLAFPLAHSWSMAHLLWYPRYWDSKWHISSCSVHVSDSFRNCLKDQMKKSPKSKSFGSPL